MLFKKKYIFLVILIPLFIIFVFIYKYKILIGRIIFPFILAAFIVYIIKPIINYFKRKNISCLTSVLIVYMGFFLSISLIFVFVLPELVSNLRELSYCIP